MKVKQEAGKEKRQRRKNLVLFIPPLALVFTFFSPCELFYIADLIKSNKSHATRTHIHK